MRPDFSIQAGSRDITEAVRDRLLELSILSSGEIIAWKSKKVCKTRVIQDNLPLARGRNTL
jgi:hypothetical protein